MTHCRLRALRHTLLLSLTVASFLSFGSRLATADTIYGTEGSDFPLNGTNSDDVIYGLGSDDWINGLLGNDVMYGGAGDDRLYVDSPNDVVVEYPNEGNDDIRTVLPTFTLNIPNVEALTSYGSAPFTGFGDDRPNIFSFGGYDPVDGNVIYGYGGDDIVNGSERSDTFWGGEGADYLGGNGGNDFLYGGSGRNMVDGGSGDDVAEGGDEHDFMQGGQGSDIIIGAGGDDELYGDGLLPAVSDGDDTIEGGEGNDDLRAGGGNDTLRGGAGSDALQGGIGADVMFGGFGEDRYEVDDVNDVVNEEPETVANNFPPTHFTMKPGDSVWVSNLSTYTLPSNVENLGIVSELSNGVVAYGNELDNTVSAGNEGAVLYGLGGNDLLVSGYGNATLVGGQGDDEYVAYSPNVTVVEEPDGGVDELLISETSFTLQPTYDYTFPANIEILYVQKIGEMLVFGNNDSNSIDGTTGDDNIAGNGGSDTLTGDKGDDILTGDSLQSSQPSGISTFGVVSLPIIIAQLTASPAATAAGNDVLDGGLGSDTARFSGTVAEYTFSYDPSSRTYTVTDRVANRDGSDKVRNVEFFKFKDVTKSAAEIGIPVIGDGGANKLSGSPGPDQIYGLDGSDTLNGLAGDDMLDGGTGADLMNGGDGNDSYVVDSLGDKIKEASKNGSGNDTVYTSLPSYTLPSNVEKLVYTGTSNFNGKGNKSGNRISGGSANDYLDGQKGVDVLIGGVGDDTFIIDNPSDLILEEQGGGLDTAVSSVSIGTLNANVEVLVLSKGNANGTGNALNNTIVGSKSNNNLSGGDGSDTLIGGMGNDTFYGESSASAGNDFDVVSFATSIKPVIFNLGITNAPQKTGGAGTDRLFQISSIEGLIGGAASDNLSGNSVDNRIEGLDGDDIIFGFSGADVLIGSKGLDTIDCGADGDIDMPTYLAVSDSPVGVGRDQVINFNADNDKVDLSGLDANLALTGDQAFTFSNTNAAAYSVWYTLSGSDIILAGDVNGDAVADFEIQLRSIGSFGAANIVL